MTTFALGELFCGPGGIALGAHRAAAEVPGVEVIHAWASDYDRSTCDTYLRNIPGASTDTVIHEDVRKLDIDGLAPIDGLAFGFPCNDFSLVGEQKGIDGTFGPLYQYGVHALDAHNPRWFVAENVGGLQSSNEGRAFKLILSALQSAGEHGYRLYPHLYKFDQYGVPQRRHRILVVGIRADLEVDFTVPSPSLYESIDVSVGRRLSHPPIAPDAANHERTRQSKNVVERLTHILPGQNAFTADLPDRLKLNVAGAKISQIYRRLEFDKPAYTVTGSGGGGTHVYHWEEPRALTNRERARIQTFPDDYVFAGSKESVRKQIGMAVPVQGAQAVFTALFRSFEGIPYDSVAANLAHLVERSADEDHLAIAN
ncbi:DNA cytosine methyltransferase [Microbacterium rhizosphaerae]|uniref:Cytosine-specific methyltransferase n=1 Tax=Microbacterium rhizosphaerae TaxID=1678237 RepID=A0ABZ0SN96_9MICO|nr:DNA cytosine methyltransferase [Microbacterium rhizosphaerae]WPR88741.1 DNA cytosine methyltransferase [Microbacterium rhizosphaerae]